MEGIQECKDAMAFMMALHMAYDKAKADDKLDMADLQLAMDPLIKLVPAIQGASKIPAEFKDMDDAEKKELCDWMKATYDISDDTLEFAVEQGICIVMELGKFAMMILKKD